MAKQKYKVTRKQVRPGVDRIDYEPQGHDGVYPSAFVNHGDHKTVEHKHGEEVSLDYEAEQKAVAKARAEAEKAAEEEGAEGAEAAESEAKSAKKGKK
jgi:hypothetical protein